MKLENEDAGRPLKELPFLKKKFLSVDNNLEL